jgi:3-oxoacyl-[acyl-carrier protein] reductase
MPEPRLVIPDLAGKVVLITGGSTGIGAAVARGFAGQGQGRDRLSRKRGLGPGAGDGGSSRGRRTDSVRADVASPADCERIVAETTTRFGCLDGLINNAGLMLGRVPYEAADEHAQAVFDLNARSVVSMTRAALAWLERNGGFVINTTSITARNGGGGGAVLYAAAKGFVSTLTRGQARELIGKDSRQRGRTGRDRDSVPRSLLGRSHD